MANRTLILLAFTIFIALILSSCSENTPTEVPTITVQITDVVDKATGGHLDDFNVTFRKETPDGVVLSSEEYTDTIDVSAIIPADGSVRLFIVVDAPGYVKYSTAMRGKYNTDKFVEILVEMTRFEGEQS